MEYLASFYSQWRKADTSSLWFILSQLKYLLQHNGAKIISKVEDRGSPDNYKYINNYMNREMQTVIITPNIKITIHIIYRSQLNERELRRYQRIHKNGYNNTVMGKIIRLSLGQYARYRSVAFEIFATKYQGTNAT